jgi:diphthamide biosynthesis methyltransferase
MRTTVTLDADTEQLIRKRMAERNMSFKEALNDAIRAGATQQRRAFRTPAKAMGRSRVNLDRAVTLAGDLEDDDLLRRMRAGS